MTEVQTEFRDVLNAVVPQQLMYGVSTWVTTRTEERKIDAVEIRMLGKILGVKRDDYIRSEAIRTRCGEEPVSL
jgi:hypothetical protein